MNPAPAARAAASESCVIPPGSYQRIVHGRPIGFQTKVKRLQFLPAPRIRATGLAIDDVRGQVTFLAAFPIESVHVLDLGSGWSLRG
jgi:hypothetical protein